MRQPHPFARRPRRYLANFLLFGLTAPSAFAAWSGATQFAQPGLKLADISSYMTVRSVALSADSNRAFVSTTCYSGCDSGVVGVFVRVNGEWSATTPIYAGILPHGGIGWAIGASEDGNRVIVGSLSNLFTGGASAWIFAFNGAIWSLEATLPGGNTAVAISGDGATALVAGNTPSDSGIWAYSRSGVSWNVQQKIASSGYPAALSTDGNTAVVGGDVYVRAAGSWIKQATLAAAGGPVAISGDGNTAVTAGFVFSRSGGVWTQGQSLPIGGAVAISRDGNTILTGTGATFTRVNELWVAHATALPAGAVALALDGSVALVATGSEPMAAFVFTASPAPAPTLTSPMAFGLGLLLAVAAAWQIRRSIAVP